MAVIEVEHGRYEADTLDAALKLSKAGERRAKLDNEARSKRQDHALMVASAKAYQVMIRMARNENENVFPHAWRLKKRGHEYCKLAPHATTGGKVGDIATYDTENGRVQFDHYFDTVEGIVWNGGGWDFITFLKVSDSVNAFAIGVCEGETRFALIPNLTMEMFQRDE